LPKTWQKKMLKYADNEDWSEALEGMLNYDNLLERVYEFYGKDIEAQEPPQDWLKDAVKKHGWFMPAQAIIGEAALTDIIQDSDDDFAETGCYHWIMTEPILYDKPITNVLGHLRLWTFET